MHSRCLIEKLHLSLKLGTLEEAVSHNVLLYQQLFIARYQVRFYANNCFESIAFEWVVGVSNAAASGLFPVLEYVSCSVPRSRVPRPVLFKWHSNSCSVKIPEHHSLFWSQKTLNGELTHIFGLKHPTYYREAPVYGEIQTGVQRDVSDTKVLFWWNLYSCLLKRTVFLCFHFTLMQTCFNGLTFRPLQSLSRVIIPQVLLLASSLHSIFSFKLNLC